MLIINPFVFANSQVNCAKLWINNKGKQLSSNANHLTQRADKVFERVKAAADKRSEAYPKIYFVNSKDFWVKSFFDGSILMTEGALNFCYCIDYKTHKVDQTCIKKIHADVHCNNNQMSNECIGDSIVSFVLGHELAHLAFGDHSYQDICSSDGSEKKHSFEYRADIYGMIYAIMAGFNSYDAIFQKNINFFQEWFDRVPSYKKNHLSHPQPDSRKKALLKKMKSIKDNLMFFHMGTRLLYIGKYEKARDLLIRFRSKYPGREVFNNIGISYYQEGIQHLKKYKPEAINRFMLSTPIDRQSGINFEDRRSLPEKLRVQYQKDFNASIHKAITQFKHASSLDPYYVPSTANVSSCYIIKESYDKALLEIESSINKEHYFLLNNRAIANFLANKKKDFINILKQVCKVKPDYYPACFNMAQISKETGLSIKLPESCAFSANKYLDISEKEEKKSSQQKSEPLSLFVPPVSIGEYTKEAHKKLEQMTCQTANLAYTVEFYYDTDTNVLVLGTRIEIVESILSPPYLNADVLKNYSKPLRIVKSVSGIQTNVYEHIAVDIDHGKITKVLFY
ncbi:TPR repeat-containing protein [Candidatus Magnetomorum sp. HK-1]|nr:TPR repeat-containing protein [Candidatus Magnetomorum sp. HK-1]